MAQRRHTPHARMLELGTVYVPDGDGLLEVVLVASTDEGCPLCECFPRNGERPRAGTLDRSKTDSEPLLRRSFGDKCR